MSDGLDHGWRARKLSKQLLLVRLLREAIARHEDGTRELAPVELRDAKRMLQGLHATLRRRKREMPAIEGLLQEAG